jgi:hypothetical protein
MRRSTHPSRTAIVSTLLIFAEREPDLRIARFSLRMRRPPSGARKMLGKSATRSRPSIPLLGHFVGLHDRRAPALDQRGYASE